MAQELTIRYDKVGDILHIDHFAPYAEQESNYLGDDVVARFNPVTGDIENLEIMFFSNRLATSHGGCGITQNLTLNYDKAGDILYIDHVKPYSEQISDEIGDQGIVARFNPDTGKIENLEIMFFTSQLMNDGTVELPVTSDMRIAE